jgi:hypothetical protein
LGARGSEDDFAAGGEGSSLRGRRWWGRDDGEIVEGMWGRFGDDTRFGKSGVETRSFRVIEGMDLNCVFVVSEGIGIEGMVWSFRRTEISAISE